MRRKNPAAGSDGHQGDRAHEAMQFAGQWRVGALGPLGEHRDTGEVGGGSRRRHDRSSFAFDHERAGAQIVAGADRVGDALTRECRGVDEQPVALDTCHVGGDPVAVGEHDEVVGNDALGIDQQRQAIAHDHHLEGQQALQACGGLLGSVLLGESEQRVDDDDDEDRDAQLREPADDRQHAGSPEHGGEEVRELGEQFAPHRGLRRFGERIRTDLAQPLRCVGRSESRRLRDIWHVSNIRRAA